jgi:hypothetical protein
MDLMDHIHDDLSPLRQLHLEEERQAQRQQEELALKALLSEIQQLLPPGTTFTFRCSTKPTRKDLGTLRSDLARVHANIFILADELGIKIPEILR